ncbi:uncharacterized protein LOC132745128 [Ruditapes philippinarum]|uniref:uncharacterized protein LOC132745128 n=1 Tax=Ruditapes philippinarum TaxID=129788 RepID=UPI00295AD800|nr:uncharacterized protein LOC132745128 [Ruditapes philippinarum]
MLSIKVFLLLWMFMGANCWRSYRTDRACTEAGKIVNGSFKESSNRYRKYLCQANYISNIPDLGDIVFKCGLMKKTGSYEWKATSTWFTDGGFLYLQNVTCEPKKKCSAPPLPKDMTREITTRYLIPVTINSVKKAINDFYTGDTVKYSCKPGLMMSNDSDTSFFSDYIYYDEPSSSSTSTTAAPATVLKDITCNADGLWNGFPDSELSFGECQAEAVEKSNGVYTESGEEKCDCIDGGLKSRKGDQAPKCTPDPCKVPLDFDKHLSISDKTHASLSGGFKISNGIMFYMRCFTLAQEIIMFTT